MRNAAIEVKCGLAGVLLCGLMLAAPLVAQQVPVPQEGDYVIRDFHPLVFFYFLGLLMTLTGLGLGIAETVLRIMGHGITVATIVLVALLLTAGSQFTLFAMWFDMESNKDLR